MAKKAVITLELEFTDDLREYEEQIIRNQAKYLDPRDILPSTVKGFLCKHSVEILEGEQQ